MGEKALGVARERLRREFAVCDPKLDAAQIDELADSAVAAINWDDPILMHKGLGWIAREFLASR